MRIGINVPNELMRRLEPLKPELNISQVCREALTAIAENHERIRAEIEGNNQIRTAVDRVWEQEQEFLTAIEFDWEMLGYQDAADWVKAAGWDEWEDLHDQLDWHKEHEKPLPWEVLIPPQIEGVKWFHDRDVELSNNIRRLDQQKTGFLHWRHRRHGVIGRQANQRKYMTAWLAYTNAVWELYVEQQKEQFAKRLAELRKPPTPELPEHLFADAQPDEKKPFRVIPFHSGYAPGVDPLKLNHLIGELDVQEFLDKQERLQ